MARNTSVSLGDHFTEFIEQQVASGRYATASDVIRAGLRLLQDQEEQMAALRISIQQGLDDLAAGRSHVVNDAYWDSLRDRVRKRRIDDESSKHRVAS